MISHACGLTLLLTASDAFLQRVNGAERHAPPAATRRCLFHQCILWCVCVYLRSPLCQSMCCLFQVATQSCLMLSMMLKGVCAQVEKAAKLFKQAGCVQSDIKAALTSHIKHDEIDIPQDEPEEAKKVSSCWPPPLCPPHKCYSTAAQARFLR